MSKFKLISPYKPAGDQPEAIKKLSNGLENGLKGQTLLGVTGSGKTFSMAAVVAKAQRPTLVISHNKTLAAQLASEFREFFPENAVHYFVSYYDYYQPESYLPTTDTYIAKETEINEEIERLRHAATQALATRRDVLIVASVSCIYGLGSPEIYEEVAIQLKKGEKYNREDLWRDLVRIQYQRNDIERKRGMFRVKGDVMEIFPIWEESFYRFDFFGSELESIQKIHPVTGEIEEEVTEIGIYPASHYSTKDDILKGALGLIGEEMKEQVARFKKNGKLLEAQRIKERTEYDMEMIREVGYCSGIENYSRYMDGRKPGEPPFTLIDYFPKDYLLFIDESHITLPQIGGMYFGDRSRKEALIDFGFRLPSALDNRPLTFKEFEKRVGQEIFVSATPDEYEKNHSQQVVEQLIRPTGLLDPKVLVQPTKNQVDDLIQRIQERVKRGERVLVTTLTKRLAEDLTEYLEDLDIKVQYLHSEIETMRRLEILRDLRLGVYDVVVGINLLREGLDLPEVSLVAIMDADKEGFLRSSTSLIQTIGRAARHQDGEVVMYADEMTGSMKKAISETARRRTVQEKYNREHGITPQTIKKAIKEERLAGAREEVAETPSWILEVGLEGKKISERKLKDLIKAWGEKMDLAARNLEFEEAAKLRDQIKEMRGYLIKLRGIT